MVMKREHMLGIVGAVSMVWLLSGCGGFLGGAAIGGAGAAGAYEYQQREAMKELEEEFAQGRITRDEYLQRKEEISERSLIQ
jgi:hypothetical protein